MLTSEEAIELESTWGARNYHPLPVVLERGQGAKVWDIEGRCYLDFLAAYSAVNQGHCHRRIVAALIQQAQKLTLTSRAFYNDQLGRYEEFICKRFGYERLLPMNTGVEAVETALKVARRWAYDRKGVAENSAKIIACAGNFHGRTMGAISLSTSADSRKGFGPYLPGIEVILFGDLTALEKAASDRNAAAFLVEPIQGEGGVILPPREYLRQAKAICERNRVLFIADEIQTGLGRTGKMLACDHDGVKPDLLLLGKALSGGLLPVSAVLGSSETLLTIGPGEHGSTYGGNPLACQVAIEAIKVIDDEKLCERAESLGKVFRRELERLPSTLVREVRGLGLMNAIEMQPNSNVSADEVCYALKKRGLLAKPTRKTTIRFTPPLVITDVELNEGIQMIRETFEHLSKV